MDAPIVLVHGTNAGPWTMANFERHFAELGWRCISPAYRHHDKPLTDESSGLLSGISIADYVDDIAAAIATLDTTPVIVGHSLGGVIAQKLAAQGLARAIVLLNGSINWGVLPTTDEERALAKALMSAGPFWETTLLPDFDTISKFGLNMPEEASNDASSTAWDQSRAAPCSGCSSGSSTRTRQRESTIRTSPAPC